MINSLNLLALFVLILCPTAQWSDGSGNAVHALKLPSFLSWIQPTSQQASKAPSSSSSSNSGDSGGGGRAILAGTPINLLQQANEEPASSVSSGVFEQAVSGGRPLAAWPSQQQQQSQVSPLRKPFQSMLTQLPSTSGGGGGGAKQSQMNHLFSSLPKSLFGRLLAGSSSSSGSSSGGGASAMLAPSYLMSSTAPASPFGTWPLQPHPMQEQQPQQAGTFTGLHQYSFQEQQQQHRHPSSRWPNQPPRKHALGLGESDDFIIMEAPAQTVANPEMIRHLPPHSGPSSEGAQQQQQLFATDTATEEYQEVPAIMLAGEQEGERQEAQYQQQLQKQTSGSKGKVVVDEFESNKTLVAEAPPQTTGRSQNSTSGVEPDLMRLVVGSNETTAAAAGVVGAESLASAELAPMSVGGEQTSGGDSQWSSHPSLASNATIPASGSEQRNTVEQQSQVNETSAISGGGNRVLPNLISDELLKLKQEPDTLNRSLASMSQPLASLFMDSALAVQSRQQQNESQQQNGMPLTAAESERMLGGVPVNLETAGGAAASESVRGLESSAAAIIVSPGDEESASAVGDDHQQQQQPQKNQQQQSAADEQIENFILGPYKGLTSDSLPQVLAAAAAEQQAGGQFRESLSPLSTMAGVHGQQQPMAPMSAHHHHHHHPQLHSNHHHHHHHHHQSHHGGGVGGGGPMGMTGMASNLIQQAKSLIQLPFVHMGGSAAPTGSRDQMPTAARPEGPVVVIGGDEHHQSQQQQQQAQEALALAFMASNQRAPTSAAAMMTMMTALEQQPQPSHNAGNNYRAGSSAASSAALFYDRPPSQQSLWPANQLTAASGPVPQQQMTGATELKPFHLNHHQQAGGNQQQQQQQQPANRYFLMQQASSATGQPRPFPQFAAGRHLMKQEPTSGGNDIDHHHHYQRHTQRLRRPPTAATNVPYFVGFPQSMNRELQQQQQHHQLQQQQLSHQHRLQFAQRRPSQQQQQSDNFNLYSPAPTSPKASHPLNDVAREHRLQLLQRQQQQQQQQPQQKQQQQQQTGFQLVVDHARPQAGFFFEQQNAGESRQPAKQQQASELLSPVSPAPRKFKSGLYQIDPPKLATDERQPPLEQQQQQQIAAPEVDEQQQVDAQAKQEADEETDDDEQVEQKQSTGSSPVPSTTRENGADGDSRDTREFARQVGASIGVLSLNRTQPQPQQQQHRGQVFSEPIGSAGDQQQQQQLDDDSGSSGSARDQKRVGGQNLSQMKALKLTQDITLYDFEVPAASQRPPTKEQPLASSNQVSLASPSGNSGGSGQFQALSGDDSAIEQSMAAMIAPNDGGLNSAAGLLDTQVYTVPYSPTMVQLSTSSAGGSALVTGSRHPNPFQELYQALGDDIRQPELPMQQQVGRFPLPYMAPPNNRQVMPQMMQQYRHVHHLPHTQPQFFNQQQAAASSSYGSSQQQQQQQQQNSFLNSIFPDFPSPAPVSQQYAGTGGRSMGGPDWSTGLASAHQSAVPELQQPQGQHYFHYQPVAANSFVGGGTSGDPERKPAQLAAPLRGPDGGGDQSPAAWEFPGVANSGNGAQQPPSQQHYVLAIQHGAGGAAPNGAAIFSSSAYPNELAALRHEERAQQQPAQVTTESAAISQADAQSIDITRPFKAPSAAVDSTSSSSFSLSTTNPSSNNIVEQQFGVSSTASSVSVDQETIAANENSGQKVATDKQDDRRESATTSTSGGPQLIQTPSAFCADRAPGLYADESQRCKAYYQCAPTGHQMFRCNNQTQFNQKTQNCDWWYNVNCGGRLGSPADFEQAIMSTTTAATTSELQQQQQSNDRDSSQTSGTATVSSQEQQLNAQQAAPPASGASGGDDDGSSGSTATTMRDLEGQQQQQHSSRTGAPPDHQWPPSPVAARQRIEEAREGPYVSRQEDSEVELFHHSESVINSTVTPSGGGEDGASGNRQSMVRNTDDRSASTQDPLLSSASSTEFSSSTASAESTQLSQQQQSQLSPAATPEAQPQVGAILAAGQQEAASREQQAPSSSSAAPSSGTNDDGNSGAATSTTTISEPTSTQSTSAAATITTTTTTTTASELPEAASTTVSSAGLSSSVGAVAPAPDASSELNNTANASRRLVQSEFGLGVQQQQQQPTTTTASSVAPKSPRSTGARFEFTRNSDNSALAAEQPHYANHKYTLATNDDHEQDRQHQQQVTDEQQQLIYSTSANQGSVSYVPVDYPANKAGLAQFGSTQGAATNRQRVDRRFGARLQIQKSADSSRHH